MTTINVRPGIESTHDLSWSDGVTTYGAKLSGGDASIVETSMVPSTLKFTSGGGKYGDFEPGMSHIEQRTWQGGRGLEDYADDATRFFDSMNCWTMTPNKLFPTSQWHISTGYRSADQYLPGDVQWVPLFGPTAYVAAKFTASASYNADKAYVWMRRIGTPGTFTLELCANNSGNPGTVLQTKTVTTTNITDVISVFQVFDWTGTQALVSGTIYFVKVYGAAADNAANHWEIGAGANLINGRQSTNNSSWTTGTFEPYFRVCDADTTTKYIPFVTTYGSFFVSVPSSGSSVIYIINTDGTVSLVSFSVGTLPAAIATDVIVSDDIIYIAYGSGTNIYLMRKNGANYETAADGGSNKADHLCLFYDPTDGPRIYRSITNNQVSIAKPVAWGASLSFGTAISVGETAVAIQGLIEYDDMVVCRKSESLWAVKDGKASKVKVGLDASRDTNTVIEAQGDFLYLSWSYSLERYYKGTMDDIGPWHDAGLPAERSGYISALCPAIGYLFVGMNAGTGTSSVLVWDGKTYHEMLRCWEANRPVTNLFWETRLPGTRPRLWSIVGGDLVYQIMPVDGLNPLRDPLFQYQHEAVMTLSAIDMGYADLPKFYKELSLVSQNLTTNIYVALDYQCDNDIGTNTWRTVGKMTQSPNDIIKIDQGKRRNIRIRLRLVTNNALKPPLIRATVLKGFARTPTKRQWNITIDVGSLQTTNQGEQDKNPTKFYFWIWKVCQDAGGVRMRAKWEEIDDIMVLIEPPNILRIMSIPLMKWWSGKFKLTIREL
jgi:hypothetical protein